MNDQELVIEVAGLVKQFKEVRAVNDLSFSVRAGEVYGFLGQNGAGKSTTIRMIMSLIRPDAGEIKLFGKSIVDHRREVLSSVGAVIERPDLYKYLSAFENLRLFASISGHQLSKNQLLNQLDQVGLLERAHSKVHTFSQGMKQRLGIAIALAHNPQLVILDEPTNGLDPGGIADIRQLIVSLSKQQGKTVLVSSHLLSEMEKMATSMVIIHKGKKVVEGKVKELMDPNKMLVDLWVNSAEAALTALQTTQWIQQVQQAPPGAAPIAFSTRELVRLQIHPDQVPLLNQHLIAQGVNLYGIDATHSLEDYFLSLTHADHVDHS